MSLLNDGTKSNVVVVVLVVEVDVVLVLVVLSAINPPALKKALTHRNASGLPLNKPSPVE